MRNIKYYRVPHLPYTSIFRYIIDQPTANDVREYDLTCISLNTSERGFTEFECLSKEPKEIFPTLKPM